MLFIVYWELNQGFDPSDLADVAQTLISKKMYPVEGEKQIGWYCSTGDYWGITITEADSEEVLLKSMQMWRIAKPGLFKVTKSSPAMEIVKMLPPLVKLGKQIKG